MNASIGRTPSQASLTVRSLLRGIGRVAIWATLALLLLRGVLAGFAAEPPTPDRSLAVGADFRATAFAVQFARSYFSDAGVAQAEVAWDENLGDGRYVFTVACELRDARTLYLAVPIARSDAGEVAALGAPSIVAAPGPAGVAPERLQPVAGRDAAEIQALVEDFLPTYISAGDAAELAYFVAPGKEVQPLGGALEVNAIAGVHQVGAGEGRRRRIVAGARLTDPATDATYSVAYRLELTKGARWYVLAVEGASA